MGEARDGSAAATTAPSSAATGADPLVGRVINDRYKILSVIARGGMGKVYRAEQAPLGRLVAIKVLHPNYKGEHDPDFHRRFFLEAATCAKLTHPNTVTIFDYGRTDDDIYYIAMELLEGRTLHRAIREDGPMSAARALHIARQICRSLREAHAIHVVHRDLKPANVFLCRRDDDHDFVKVLDFGLVKNVEENAEELTQTGLFMGSPKYMAPEQIQGERADGRVDIYALGVILYEMLTGKVPFDRPNSVNILMAHIHDEPPSFEMINPEVQIPPALEAVVRKCLAKKAEDRYATMDQLLLALKAASDPDTMGLSAASLVSSDLLRQSGENSIVAQLPQPSLTPSGVIVTGARAAVDASGPVPTTNVGTPLAESAPARPAGTPAWVWVLGIVVALGVVVAAFVIFGKGSGAPQTTSSPTPPVQVGTSPQPGSSPEPSGSPETSGAQPNSVPSTPIPNADPTPSPAPARVRVSLTSIPSGAAVRLGNRRLGVTPLEIELEGDDARPGTEHAFVFSLPGFQVTTIRRTVGQEPIAVEARLTRRTGGMAGGDQSHVEGYRDDPYADP